jgi:mannan endo-1,4-beta-mannosidase
MDSPNDLDGVPFDSIRSYIRAIYDRGGVNTISWHLNNPGSGGSAWDTSHVVKDILPGGTKHALYVTWLDKVAVFLNSLKGSDGKSVPVIFRPFHEHTGSWFWWGQRHCSVQEFKQLWQFTINRLQKKGVHNALYAYSAADYADEAAYLERYPGDQFVDVIGTDIYQYSTDEVYTKESKQRLELLDKIAADHHKIPALTETGYERIPASEWWTNTLLPILKAHRVSYVLMWRNGRPDHYYAPFTGQASEADFRKFYEDPYTIFQKELTEQKTGGADQHTSH